jgi:hypothetical protein
LLTLQKEGDTQFARNDADSWQAGERWTAEEFKMKITTEETFTLILTKDELETIREGQLAFIAALRPEDYVGSDPRDPSQTIIDAVTQLIGPWSEAQLAERDSHF